MKKYLDLLFLNSICFDEDILSNSLFISIDNTSALRKEYNNVLSLIKRYNSYKIIKADVRQLHEGYEQGLFVVECDSINLFIRIILSDKLIYDVLIYTIKDMDLINRVFFNKKEIKIPCEFIEKLESGKLGVILNKEDSTYRILKANKLFYERIKYEDWDFANKYQNVLNQIAVDNIDLNDLYLYQSDKNIINISCDVINDSNIFCLIEK